MDTFTNNGKDYASIVRLDWFMWSDILSLTISLLAYYMLKCPRKCAPAVPAFAHFLGYLNNQ